MAKGACEKPDCTVAVTGTCLLAHQPPTQCPHYRGERADALEVPADRLPAVSGQVYGGLELGTQEAAELMAAQYGHVAAVLGDTGAGKTCFLCALYLLASCRELHPRFTFAGSRTLPGFETRLRLLRNWDRTGLPETIVDHTVLSDPRRPGFLHLALRGVATRRVFDFVFSDLPGEWSQGLVTKAASSRRFSFLRRADSIILAIDTGRLRQPETRHVQLQWARILLQRLVDGTNVSGEIPVVLMLTKCDLYGAEVPEHALRLQEAAASIGFASTGIVPISSFSSRPDTIASGTGIAAVLEAITADWREQRPIGASLTEEGRCFGRFRTSCVETVG